MARHREEARLGAARRIGLVAGLSQRAFAFGPIGDVTADALHLCRAAGVVADEALAPRDPARAERACNLLVVNAGAGRFKRGIALFQNRKPGAAADQRAARQLRQLAIGIVGVADAAFGIAQHDQIALRFKQQPGALLGFLQLPVPVGHRFIVKRDLAQLLAHQADANAQGRERDTGDRKQEGDADREVVRVITGVLRPASGNESIGAAEYDGEHHQRAKDEADPRMTAGEAAQVQFDPESPPHHRQ